jgi:predicted O-methyltransferase YrrM
MDARLLEVARAAKGFMPDDEGLALNAAGRDATSVGPLLEVGSYCGKSAIYLGAAAQQRDTVLFSVDHHRGSEENHPGWEWHEPDLVDPHVGRIDTLPIFRRTVHDAGLEGTVVALVADSPTLAAYWNTPLALLFIDGGHGTEPAHRDYELWTPYVKPGGLLLIHDVFPDPADGGRPPYEIYCRARESKRFEDVSATGSLRALRSVAVEG